MINMNEKQLQEAAKEILEAPMASQGMSQSLDMMYRLAASFSKGSRLNKGLNKTLGTNYNKDFAKMEKSMQVVIDTFSKILDDYTEKSGVTVPFRK